MIPLALQRLIKNLKIFPGVGQKTAKSFALHLIERDRDRASSLQQSIEQALQDLAHCKRCGLLQDSKSHCLICDNPERDNTVLLIVPTFFDALHFEELQCFRGLYHVLGGHLSPLHNIGPLDLRLSELKNRLQGSSIQEIVLALSPTLEGEATAYYIATTLMKDLPIKLTRLATGIPVGGSIEHIDAHTLSLSMQQRSEYKHLTEDS